MTTIAYRDRVMASDSRVTIKDFVFDNNSKKIWRLSDGSLFGASGDVVGGFQLLDLLRFHVRQKKFTLPNKYCKGTKALFVSPKGVLYYYETGYWEELGKRHYSAVGSGAKYALAAMDAGANAVQACRIGIHRDVYSGGRVRSFKL